MSDEQKKISIYESRRFAKSLNKLPKTQLKIIEDEIDRIIESPDIGSLKKGDLSHLRVHKFKLENQLALLGYTWLEGKLEIYLLQLGPHENFYQKMKSQRKPDAKLLGS